MAQLLKISKKTYREGVNEVGDIVGVFSDNHKFSKDEEANFDIAKVDGMPETINLLIPTVRILIKAKTLDWTFEQPEKKEVWLDSTDGKYKDVVKRPKYALYHEEGEIKRSHSRHAENLISAGTIK